MNDPMEKINLKLNVVSFGRIICSSTSDFTGIPIIVNHRYTWMSV